MTTLTVPGRHRDKGLVLPAPPGDAERESYAWRALPFLTIALFISSLSIVLAQALMEIRNAPVVPVAAALFGTFTLIYLVYQLVSLPVNFTGRSFDLAAHDALVSSWRPERYPDVDIYLPICGEPIEVRRLVELVHQLTGSRSKLLFGALPHRPGEPMLTSADTKALQALGWQPQVSLEEGLRRTIEAEKK